MTPWSSLDEAPIEEDVLLYLPDGCQQVGWARWRLDDHTISTDPEALCWAPLPDPPPS